MKIAGNIYTQNIFEQKNKNITFTEAWVNILAAADGHGKLTSLPALYDTVKINAHNIFPNAGQKNTLNIFAQIGDVVINPLKKGFITNPEKSAGDIQFWFFQKLISNIKKLVKSEDKSAKFISTYTPGNHCFDGGDKWLFGKIKNAQSQTILTNAKLKQSPVWNKLTPKEKQKISNFKIYEIPDDKNPEIKHKLLTLGITLSGVDFYNPGLVKDLKIIDACNKNDLHTNENDLKETYKALNKIVGKFKHENPNGAILLQSHAGNKITEMVVDHVKGINLVLSGHDHEDAETIIKNTHIISLGKDNEVIKSLRLHFDDNGKLSNVGRHHIAKTFYTENTPATNDNPLQKILEHYFKEDSKPVLKIIDSNNYSDTLDIKKVRSKNSVLANYVTDVIYDSLKKEHPALNTIGILSSTFRNGLKNNANNLELMKVFDGSIEPLSEMYVGKIKGSQLFDIICENVKSNLENPEKNTIIQWSGITINKSQANYAFTEKDPIRLKNAFKIKDISSGNKTEAYKAIDSEKLYEVALPLKYLVKYDASQTLKTTLQPTGKTIDGLFRNHLETNNYTIKITPKVREKRIIS